MNSGKVVVIQYIIFIFMLMGSLHANDNKIIYMITAPRTVSTAFLRMMDNREDFVVYNEPSIWSYIWSYNKVHNTQLTEPCFRKEAFQSFGEVKQKLFEELEQSNVFVKEMSFSMLEFLSNDPEFMSNPKVHFVFMLRDPHATTISFCNKNQVVMHRMSDLIGLKKLYQLFQLANIHSPNPVKIITSEKLCHDPERVVKAFCEAYQIPSHRTISVGKPTEQISQA